MPDGPNPRLVRSLSESARRLVDERSAASQAADAAGLKKRAGDLTRPPSLSGGMRKAGIALIAAPDPFTGVPGVALLASSFVLKSKEPASLTTLAVETRRVLRDIQQLGI